MHFSFTVPFVASRKSGAHCYHPVPAPDEETLLALPESKETLDLTSKRNFFLELSFWLTVFATLSIAVTIRNLLVIQLYSQEPDDNYREAYIGSAEQGVGRREKRARRAPNPVRVAHVPGASSAVPVQ
jgi:hypothetical protein